jgi:transcriptional regulator with XRE-family HTH domain
MAPKSAKKKRNTVPITPSVLRWAMGEAGFTVESLAEKLKVTAGSIRAWLSEEEQPGLTEFRKLASTLARIPAVFLLPEPPSTSTTPSVEFRHPPDSRASLNPTERRYIREAGRLQEAATWLMGELREEAPTLPKVRVGSSVDDVAAATRKQLTGSLNGSFGSRWQNEFQAFHGWRDVLERSGILVFVLPLGKESCRGFSLWDNYAPLIAVNSAWRHSARIFTLFHEYGHLLTRTNDHCVSNVLS